MHDQFPPVSAFTESIFTQLAEGKNELAFGLSEMLTNAAREQVYEVFERMNSN